MSVRTLEWKPSAPPVRPGQGVHPVAEVPQLLTVAQVMARLQVGKHVVYDLIRSRRLASVRIGRCRRIPADALAAFIASAIDKAVA
jgi:excisionase family DNA binding protein